MKSLISRISKFFNETFPIHPNATVEALRDERDDAEQRAWFQRLAYQSAMSWGERAERRATAAEEAARGELMRNESLVRCCDSLREEISRMLDVPAASRWLPAHVAQAEFKEYRLLRIDVPPLSMAMRISPQGSVGNELIARHIADSYYASVQRHVLDYLNPANKPK